MVKTKEILKWGCYVTVNNGQNTMFLEDVWNGTEDGFPSLYNLSADKDCLVSDCWEGDGWNIKPLEMKT